jgi:hypothetical protein
VRIISDIECGGNGGLSGPGITCRVGGAGGLSSAVAVISWENDEETPYGPPPKVAERRTPQSRVISAHQLKSIDSRFMAA